MIPCFNDKNDVDKLARVNMYRKNIIHYPSYLSEVGKNVEPLLYCNNQVFNVLLPNKLCLIWKRHEFQ